MLMKVVVENGVKKLVPLTADAGSGNPCGTIITTLSNTVPSGYLPLGAQFDTTQFPVLYAILGSDTIPTASALGLPTLSAGRYVIKATSGINENQADNVLSALTPVDQVALNNLHSVTSGAVYSKINELLYQNYYNANTNRTNIENRKQAILHVIKNFPSSMFTIRYSDGYYIFYIANPFFTSERTILEIDNYNGEINIYQVNSLDTTISLVRSI